MVRKCNERKRIQWIRGKIMENNFREDLTDLINKHSKENGSDTPDFILARYLENCLEAFDIALQERDRLTVINT